MRHEDKPYEVDYHYNKKNRYKNYDKYRNDVEKLIDKIGVRDIIDDCVNQRRKILRDWKKENRSKVNWYLLKVRLREVKKKPIFQEKFGTNKVILEDGIINQPLYIKKRMDVYEFVVLIRTLKSLEEFIRRRKKVMKKYGR